MSDTNTVAANGGSLGNPKWDTWFFGHPRGLSTLFFTEMWERFSYYGMRAILILFMVAPLETGGMGFDVVKAGAIYGLYTASVYLLSLPGGWIADNLIGQRRAVLLGGVLIAAGHYVLSLPTQELFYWGLLVIAPGVGLLKPNISAMVGQLYRKGDGRRDSGFSIYYMGINIGAFLAPLACGYVGQRIDWHLGFLIAGVGMTLGLVQFWLGGSFLGTAGIQPGGSTTPEALAVAKKRGLTGGLITAAVIGAVVLATYSGVVELSPEDVANLFGVVLLVVTLAFFGWLFGAGNWTRDERNKLVVVVIFFVATVFFWSAFEQAGSTLNLFAERSTRNEFFGIGFPASWFQSLNALFIIALAPVFAWLWVWLGKREPASPTKFALGLLLVGAGFGVMIFAAQSAADGSLVSPWWLSVMYLLHTLGELCVSPVGLSAITKLAPERVTGLIMGVWFLSPAVANYISGRLAGLYESMPLEQLFGLVTAFTIGSAVVMALLVPWAKRLMGEVK
ncbi:MAG: peptide MFS transporter [Bryobacterales bacterium]|nr:peptide MFS transporter [Bryobacterales bacterium]